MMDARLQERAPGHAAARVAITGRPAGRTWSVRAEAPVHYEVALADDVFEYGHPALDPEPGKRDPRRFAVIDANVERLYGDLVRTYFDRRGVRAQLFAIDVAEEGKTIATLSAIVDAVDCFGIDRRREPIIAIGGGVLLDVVGLAASLYRRGTPYIRIPTTLIGLVDAGVGVKTAVNHNRHKNRLGSYYAPQAALLDRRFLATLERRHVANGLAEILKMGLVIDTELFELLERHGAGLLDNRFQGGDPAWDAAAVAVLEHAVAGMLDELSPNLWEHRLDRRVDYGHSVGPAIEMAALPHLLHGESVAIDMALFTEAAVHRAMISAEDAARIYRTMRRLELPIWHPLLERPLLEAALADTVRHRGGRQRLSLPTGIGSVCFVNDVTVDELVDAAQRLAQRQAADA